MNYDLIISAVLAYMGMFEKWQSGHIRSHDIIKQYTTNGKYENDTARWPDEETLPKYEEVNV